MAELTDSEDGDTPIMTFRGERYICKNLLIEDYNIFQSGMGRALTVLKETIAAFFGLAGLAAFLREDAITHDTMDPSRINHDYTLQRQSVHADGFRFCGSYVNSFQEINNNIAEVMEGITFPGSDEKYVCVDDLEVVIDQSVRDSREHEKECKEDGKFSNDFNPGDPRSVRASVQAIVDRQD
jgi:hypothetical protein